MSDAIADLAARWRRARCAALSAALSEERSQEPEIDLLARALEHAPAPALRAVFDNSLALGQGFRRFYRADLTLRDLAGILPELGSPCVGAAWSPLRDAPAYVSERAGCAIASAHPRACEYWREAIGGLVLGLSSGVHHARHASLGSGGPRCLDVLFVDPQSSVRYAAIPQEIADGLAVLRRTARAIDSSAEIEFLGIAENVLHYTVRYAGAANGLDLTEIIRRGVKRRFPWLDARDVSPRAVFDDDAR